MCVIYFKKYISLWREFFAKFLYFIKAYQNDTTQEIIMSSSQMMQNGVKCSATKIMFFLLWQLPTEYQLCVFVFHFPLLTLHLCHFKNFDTSLITKNHEVRFRSVD